MRESVITSPSYPQTIEKGFVELRGIAWSGRGLIRRVDISTDGGRSWKPATLQQPVLPKAVTCFRYAWEWDGRPTEIVSRAIDETGYVQPEMSAIPASTGTTNAISPQSGNWLDDWCGWTCPLRRSEGSLMKRLTIAAGRS
jgi:hypothetical protein